MPIETVSGPDAVVTVRQNPYARYPRPDTTPERLIPFPIPESQPTFQIHRKDRIFTMGSCFAREIEQALRCMGFEITSRTEAERHEKSWYNKYTIHSILNEIRWAVDPAYPYPGKDALLEIPGRGWTDPQINRKFMTSTVDEMLAFRSRYHRSMVKIRQSDVIILTLGLVEAWYDTKTGLYLNSIPPQYHINKTPDRFELRVLAYEDILDALEDIYALIKRFCKPSVKFLITVSPIPLNATFRQQDVLVANCYSKCVQRAALEVFVRRHDNVDYFPSYEFATINGLEYDIKRDFRHITREAVSRIMSHVLSRYLQAEEAEAIKLSLSLDTLWEQGDYAAICRLADHADRSLLAGPILHVIGRAYKKSGRPAEALKIYLSWHKKDKKSRLALKSAITTAIDLRRYRMAEHLATKHRATFPIDNQFEQKIKRSVSLQAKIWRLLKNGIRNIKMQKAKSIQ